MDKYREMARRLDLDATALETRASGYKMAGDAYLARVTAQAAVAVRDAAEALRGMRAAETRVAEAESAA